MTVCYGNVLPIDSHWAGDCNLVANEGLLWPFRPITLHWPLAGIELAGNCSANIPANSMYFSKKSRRHAKGMSRDFFREMLEPTVPALPVVTPTGVRSQPARE